MIIREISDKDLHGLLALYTHLHANPIPEENDTLLTIWTDILTDRNHHIIVAVEDNTIISSCVLIIVPNLTHNQEPYALIENVVTLSHFRKQGIATACLDFGKQIAFQHGCYKIMLMTGSKSDSILNFYRRAGYNSNDKTAFIQWL